MVYCKLFYGKSILLVLGTVSSKQDGPDYVYLTADSVKIKCNKLPILKLESDK